MTVSEYTAMKIKISKEFLIILLVIISGTALRIWLATFIHRSDVDGFVFDAELFRSGKNLYLNQTWYNYSPVFYYILGYLDKFQQVFYVFPLRLLIHLLLIFTDLTILFVLIAISRLRSVNPAKTAAFFYLNPISVIITGYHGQFDNLAVLFLLIGVFLYLSKSPLINTIKMYLIWPTVTFGVILKHTVIFPVYAFWLYITGSALKGTILFLSFLPLFLFSFIPFLPEGKSAIIENVLKYRSMEGLYGISFLTDKYCPNCNSLPEFNFVIRNVFLVGFALFILFFRSRDLIRSLLISFLFFLAFTTGIGGQYFVFPVYFASLLPSLPFLLYTIAVTLFYLGNNWEFNLSPFGIFSWNFVWIFVLFWFAWEVNLELKKRKSGKSNQV